MNSDTFADVTTSDIIDFQSAAPVSCIGGHCADITLRIVNT